MHQHVDRGRRSVPDLTRDGLAGEEGTFLLCTFWLAQAQALAGDVETATVTFERAVAAINDVGLLADQPERSGIGSASAARHSGGSKGSAKYWVSWATRPPENSMMLTEWEGTPS